MLFLLHATNRIYNCISKCEWKSQESIEWEKKECIACSFFFRYKKSLQPASASFLLLNLLFNHALCLEHLISYHLPFTICHLPSTIYHLPFAIHHFQVSLVDTRCEWNFQLVASFSPASSSKLHRTNSEPLLVPSLFLPFTSSTTRNSRQMEKSQHLLRVCHWKTSNHDYHYHYHHHRQHHHHH